jgi:hypothetical protein
MPPPRLPQGLPGGLQAVAELRARGVSRMGGVAKEKSDFKWAREAAGRSKKWRGFVGLEKYLHLPWMPVPWSITLRAGYVAERRKPSIQWYAHF